MTQNQYYKQLDNTQQQKNNDHSHKDIQQSRIRLIKRLHDGSPNQKQRQQMKKQFIHKYQNWQNVPYQDKGTFFNDFRSNRYTFQIMMKFILDFQNIVDSMNDKGMHIFLQVASCVQELIKQMLLNVQQICLLRPTESQFEQLCKQGLIQRVKTNQNIQKIVSKLLTKKYGSIKIKFFSFNRWIKMNPKLFIAETCSIIYFIYMMGVFIYQSKHKSSLI